MYVTESASVARCRSRVGGNLAMQLFQHLDMNGLLKPLEPFRELVGPVGAADADVRPLARAGHADEPGIAAHLAVLDERPAYIVIDMHLDLLPAVGAGDREGVHLHRRTISELRVGVPRTGPCEGIS